MSISLFSAALNSQPEQNLMPSNWPIEVLIMWCRTLALHGDRAFSPRQNEELYAALGLYVERILSQQDTERLRIFRDNSDLMFDQLVAELDEAIRNELISQTIHYGTGRVSLEDLFHAHFTERTLSQECNDLDRK
ncbi:hypothetical protein [Massilia soli]|uniref:Uncharacterized protein n=1 Tax=Massilia soli TaxID=2792854 RepID=A0ABS7SMK4_9BURK|nr:hypothetical protein [Massilia soli]MBZ2206523.1 hypothetical protein [Massilia soli]